LLFGTAFTGTGQIFNISFELLLFFNCKNFFSFSN